MRVKKFGLTDRELGDLGLHWLLTHTEYLLNFSAAAFSLMPSQATDPLLMPLVNTPLNWEWKYRKILQAVSGGTRSQIDCFAKQREIRRLLRAEDSWTVSLVARREAL